MNRQKTLEDLESLQDKVEKMGFKGQNEHDLHLREEIADYIKSHQGDVDRKILADCWREAQAAMLRNGGNPTMSQPFQRFINIFGL